MLWKIRVSETMSLTKEVLARPNTELRMAGLWANWTNCPQERHQGHLTMHQSFHQFSVAALPPLRLEEPTDSLKIEARLEQELDLVWGNKIMIEASRALLEQLSKSWVGLQIEQRLDLATTLQINQKCNKTLRVIAWETSPEREIFAHNQVQQITQISFFRIWRREHQVTRWVWRTKKVCSWRQVLLTTTLKAKSTKDTLWAPRRDHSICQQRRLLAQVPIINSQRLVTCPSIRTKDAQTASTDDFS